MLLISTFLVTGMNGQDSIYILGDQSSFSNLERLLILEEIDSVFILSDKVIDYNKSPKANGTAHYYKGLAEEAVLQYGLAKESYDKAIELFSSSNYQKGLALAYAKKANLYAYNEEFIDAHQLYNLSIQYAEDLNFYEVLIDVFQKKAIIYNNTNDPEMAIQYLERALQFALMAKDDNQTKTIINQISTNYHSIGELDSAIYYFQKGLQLKQGMNDPNGLISDYSALGNLFRERGEYEKAQRNLMEALNIAKEEKDSFSMTTIYTELGDIYTAQNIWNVAEDYYNRALQLARIKSSRFMEAGSLKKLGHISLVQKKDSTAIRYYEAALDLYVTLNNKVNIAEVLIRLSQLYNKKTEFDRAKVLLLESLATSSQSQDVMSVLSTKLALAGIEIKLGNYSRGIVYAEECLDAYEKMDDKENIGRLSLLLSEAYALTGNYRKAFLFHQNYSSIKDSLLSVERAEAVKKYDLLFTTKMKDKEIALQNERIRDQKLSLLRKNNQVLLLAGGLGFIAMVAALMFFVYRKNKQLNQQRIRVLKKEQETQRLKSIIEGEEKERKRFARELHDGLGAVLATVKMQISSIRHKFPDVQSSSMYQKAETLIDDACRTVREVSHDLMPHVLEQQGLFPAIDDMCQNLAGHHNLQFDFIPFGDENDLSDIIKITIYRIVQELLKNITKHAQATEVIVQLTIEDDEIILIVEDNGKGFEPSASQKGIGIENIHSRAAYLNGTFDIDSVSGQGSTFTIRLPSNA
jgi:signal transduction histidine kinase